MGRNSAPPLNGELIRRARLRKRLTQSEVGQLCAERGHPLDQGNLSRIERGRIKWPSMRALPALADVLGLDVDELFDTDDDEDADGRTAA